MLVIQPRVDKTIMIDVNALAAAIDLVPLENTSMNAKPVGVLRAASISPRQNKNVRSIPKPMAPLIARLEIITLGKVLEASLNSSDMCVAASAPRRESTGTIIPTRQDTPVLLHPLLLNVVKTSLELFFGARARSGTMMPKKPAVCRNSAPFSTAGSR